MNRLSCLVLALACVSPATSAFAQCLQWESTFQSQGFDDTVNALVVFQSCAGGEPSLYAGGYFTTAGGVPAAHVARWNGSVWSPVGAGLPGVVNALCVYDDGSGSGPELYAGGYFGVGPCGVERGLAKWDGVSWTIVCDASLGGLPVAPVNALAVYNPGGGAKLYVGGEFFVIIGGTGTSNIVAWDGATFSKLGAGASGNTFSSHVSSLGVFDDGAGPELVVGGEIDFPGNHIARWNGSSWSTYGGGVGGFATFNTVAAVAVFDDGTGPALYAGGAFSVPGGGFNIARWDGSAWHSVGGSVQYFVYALLAFGDGANPSAALYAGGYIETANGMPVNRIARWDGSSWSTLGTGIDSPPGPGTRVLAMAAFNDHVAGDSDLYVGGSFATAGGVTSPSIAEWSGCGTLVGTAFCFGDGSLATPCPCAPPDFVPSPPAALRHGCANSFNVDGAQLFGRGSTALDSVVLTSSGQTPVAFAFFFVGTADSAAGVAVGDGVSCVGGALTRFGSQFAVCGSVRYPNPPIGWTLPLSVVSGTTPGSAVTKYYQVYYRNAAASFCSGGTANLTNGYRITW